MKEERVFPDGDAVGDRREEYEGGDSPRSRRAPPAARVARVPRNVGQRDRDQPEEVGREVRLDSRCAGREDRAGGRCLGVVRVWRGPAEVVPSPREDGDEDDREYGEHRRSGATTARVEEQGGRDDDEVPRPLGTDDCSGGEQEGDAHGVGEGPSGGGIGRCRSAIVAARYETGARDQEGEEGRLHPRHRVEGPRPVRGEEQRGSEGPEIASLPPQGEPREPRRAPEERHRGHE